MRARPILAVLLLAGVAWAQEKPRTLRVPFHNVDRWVVLDVKVNGRAAVVLLDTGANVSIFRHAAVNSIQLELEPNHFLALNALNFDQAGIATLKMSKNFPYVDGILGEDVLRSFSAVRIDYKASVVEFEK